jgi:hypothetical protein
MVTSGLRFSPIFKIIPVRRISNSKFQPEKGTAVNSK